VALTLGGGPLATRGPETVNYRIDGPPHRLLWQPFPRRVRAVLDGELVLDTRDGKLLHESNLLPQLYAPRGDVNEDLLEPSAHTTHCPFKGDAAYFSVRAGAALAENAVWSYPAPTADASWLRGHVAVRWEAMDAWFDEADEVFGHLCDPYHRVDIRATSAHVRVQAVDGVVAETRRAKLLSETGLPNRYYVPPEDVRLELLEPSGTHTSCPYKGRASYRGLRAGPGIIRDAAWFYPSPLDGAARIADHLCFLADGVDTYVDGRRI